MVKNGSELVYGNEKVRAIYKRSTKNPIINDYQSIKDYFLFQEKEYKELKNRAKRFCKQLAKDILYKTNTYDFALSLYKKFRHS